MAKYTYEYEHRIEVPEEHSEAVRRALSINGFYSGGVTEDDRDDKTLRIETTISINIPTEHVEATDHLYRLIEEMTVKISDLSGESFELFDRSILNDLTLNPVRDNMHNMTVRLLESIVRTALPDDVEFLSKDMTKP